MPFPRQRGHGCESANSPCASADDAAAAALGTGPGCRARLRSRSLARRARRLEADRNRRLHAAQRVLEGEIELDLHVLAAPAALRLRPHAATPAAEDPAEQVAEIAELAEVERERTARPELGTAARGAPGVVLLALLRVGEDVVGGLHLLEHLLRLFVTRVLVRVVLPGELAVGLLDLVLRGALLEAEHLVQVLSRSRRHALRHLRSRRPWPAATRGRPAGTPSGSPRGSRPPRPRTAASAAPRARAGSNFPSVSTATRPSFCSTCDSSR